MVAQSKRDTSFLTPEQRELERTMVPFLVCTRATYGGEVLGTSLTKFVGLRKILKNSHLTRSQIFQDPVEVLIFSRLLCEVSGTFYQMVVEELPTL